MRPIKEPCPGWYTIDAWHYLSWQRLAHPEGSRDGPARRSRFRLAFFPPGPLPCAGPVEPPWSSLARPMLTRHGDGRRVPARILPPPTGNLPRGYPNNCPSLKKGGRSEAGGGSWPQWPERAPLQGAKVTRCISIESEPLMRRASESLNVCVFASTATNTMRSMV